MRFQLIFVFCFIPPVPFPVPLDLFPSLAEVLSGTPIGPDKGIAIRERASEIVDGA